MSMVTDFFVFGLSIGALYALIAIGFTLIFSIRGVANLAHGALLMLGAYTIFWLAGEGVPISIALVLTFAIVFVTSVLFYWLFVRPVEDQPLTALIVTLLFALLFTEIVRNVTGGRSRSIDPLISGNINVIGATLPLNRIAAFVVSWVLIIMVWYLVTRTYVGQAIIAASIDEKGAASVGVSIDRINLLVWGLAGGLAAVAGYFWGSFVSVSPDTGLELLLTAFVIVVVGGLGSVRGSLIAAYIIGMAETGTSLLIGPGVRGLLSFVLLVLILLVRPEGLFGNRQIELG
jgi:branched-chain amino acid transport system permease protein